MHILGLLHAPDANHGPAPELVFDGVDTARLSDGQRTRLRARQMGFVFQDFNLVPTLTALENVLLACDYAGLRGAPAKAAALGPRLPQRRRWPSWTSRTGPTIAPPSSPAASSSGSRSRELW
jgi:predicted ABC-type transport system involved in lysophospholipase L1 biosynthesis ATPase subunit